MKPSELPLFATDAFPLRPSKLDILGRCSMQAIFDEIDTSNMAADTGSAVHAMAHAFHQTPQGAQQIVEAMRALDAALVKFPFADRHEAELHFTPYSLDPRNSFAVIVASEIPVTVRIPPHRIDHTKRDIIINGTLDQIREENGVLNVVDIKTGKPSGYEMVHNYAYQQAAYLLGAKQAGYNVRGAFLLRTWGYRARNAELPSPAGVFWAMPYLIDDIGILMSKIALNVALIRAGEIDFGPGAHCTYCPHGGLHGCIPKAKELF